MKTPCGDGRPPLVKAHVLRKYELRGWNRETVSRWSYQDLRAQPEWFKGWISFDSVTWNPNDGKVYCGLNSMDGDLLYRFDPQTERFESMNSQHWTDDYDVKIHRTLLLNPEDECFYFGTSMLHDKDEQHKAEGGKLVKFEPNCRRYELIDIPVPHQYIQSIAADWDRKTIYGFTYPAEALFKTDLSTKSSRLLAYIGTPGIFAQPHNAAVDKAGWLWGTYAETRAWDDLTGAVPIRLFKYHPDKDHFVWFDYGLPMTSQKDQLLPDPPKSGAVEKVLHETRHPQDFGFCDSMVYDGARYIYAATVAGTLSRIDTQTDRAEKIAHVMSSGRFPALAFKDGILYGGGGMKGFTQMMRWDVSTDRIEVYTDLVDRQMDDRPARIHEIAVDDGHCLYLGENDNHSRSGFLWTVRLS